VPKYYYLDAAPLICCADSLVANPVERDAKVGTIVRGLIEGSDVTAISEITLLEVHTVICNHWRNKELPEHDAHWADGAFNELMGWLDEGFLKVLPAPPRLAEMAMANVEEVTRHTPFALRAFDAAHLVHAVAWSREVGSRVTLVAWDKAFQHVLTTTPAFQSYIELFDPWS
jgi:hypothetical protein